MSTTAERTYAEVHRSHPWTNPHHPECDDSGCPDERPACWRHAEDLCGTCGTTGLHPDHDRLPCPDCHGHGAVGYLLDGTPDPDFGG